MATLKLNNTTVFTESNGVASIPSAVKFPAGHVINVWSDVYTNNPVMDGSTLDLLSITVQSPASISSQFFIITAIQAEYGNNEGMGVTVSRNSTAIYTLSQTSILPYGVNRDRRITSLQWIDSPNTIDTIVYKISIDSFGAMQLNYPSGNATLQVFEIVG